MKKILLSMVLVLGTSNVASANAPFEIPQEQFNNARAWLARACIAEEGWQDYEGCAAVMYVYGRRWKMYKSRGRNISFEQVIRGHAAALRPQRRNFSDRQRMIIGLPETAPTETAREVYFRTLEHVDTWFSGGVSDPCRGNPMDFGGSNDHVPSWWERAQCSGGHNRFWIPRPRPAVAPATPVIVDANGNRVVRVADMQRRMQQQRRNVASANKTE